MTTISGLSPLRFVIQEVQHLPRFLPSITTPILVQVCPIGVSLALSQKRPITNTCTKLVSKRDWLRLGRVGISPLLSSLRPQVGWIASTATTTISLKRTMVRLTIWSTVFQFDLMLMTSNSMLHLDMFQECKNKMLDQ